MDYDKMPYDYLVNKYANLNIEQIKLKSQISFRENHIAARLFKERLIDHRYSFDGVSFNTYPPKDCKNYEFTFSKESGYETYHDSYYVPSYVLDDISRLDEWLEPKLKERDIKEAEHKFAEIKREYKAQQKKLADIRALYPNLNFDGS